MTEETKPVEREAFDPTLTLRAIQRVEHALHVKIGNTDFAAVERILVEEVVTPTKRASAAAALERAREAMREKAFELRNERINTRTINDLDDAILALKGSR